MPRGRIAISDAELYWRPVHDRPMTSSIGKVKEYCPDGSRGGV